MADQEIEDNKIPVRKWIRRHYKETRMIFVAICRHCQSTVDYGRFSCLRDHLIKKHLGELTEKQKIDNKVHWSWDYFVQISNQKAMCNICEMIIDGKRPSILVKHLLIHRRRNVEYKIFDPNSDINMDDVSSNKSRDTTIKDMEYQKTLSTSTISNLTDNMDGSGVSNKLTRSTSRSTYHIRDRIFSHRDVTEQPLPSFHDVFSPKSHELYLSALNALKLTDHNVNCSPHRSVTEQQPLLSNAFSPKSYELYLSALSTLKSMDRIMDCSPHRRVTEQ